MADPEPEATTTDALLGGSVLLRQPRRGHRAGTDAVLLAQLAARHAAEGLVVDMGAASGAVGLMMARLSPAASILLVERDPTLVELCRENVALNRLESRVSGCRVDLFSDAAARIEAGFPAGTADVVATNPPFFDGTDGIRVSPHSGRRDAHVMSGGTLAEWLEAAAAALRSGGWLCLIHRADALPACLAALDGSFGSVEVTPVQRRAEEGASRILLTARKGRRGPFRLAQPLVLHSADGAFTPEADALHRPPGCLDAKRAPAGALDTTAQ